MSARHAQISPSIKSSSDIENNASLDVIPSQEDIEQIENLIVQGSDGENTSFRSIFTGPGFPRRVLMIFIGQFSNPVRAFPYSISIICAGFEATCGMMLK